MIESAAGAWQAFAAGFSTVSLSGFGPVVLDIFSRR